MDPLGAQATGASPSAGVGASGHQNNQTVDWHTLTNWADLPSLIRKPVMSADDPLAPSPPPLPPVKFEINDTINRKVILWQGGNITKLSVDAIVNSTNEMLNERNGISEQIISLAGRELLGEIHHLEGCRTGEAKITHGHNLPARHIIHTVGPRYNVKYRTAAESALHSCYRSSMELVKETNLSSIAFPVVNSVRRGYPPEAGAHMCLRTVRRFLEKFGEGIDAVIFILLDEMDVKAYETTMPLYFPRTEAELEYAQRHLPDDVGNEFGEPVQLERRIRIGDMPRATDSSMFNRATIGDDNPLSAWADPSREPEMPEPQIDKQKLVNMLSELRGDHDAIRKEEMINKAPSGQEDTIRRYNRWLRRARSEDLSDLNKLNIFYISGVDALGRTVVCVVGKNYRAAQMDRDRLLLHMIDKLDLIANKDFVIVYFNADCTGDNRPDYTYVREVYNVLHPKYRRNLKVFFLVHPTWWVRLSIIIMNTFFISDIREKVHMIDRLSDLYDTIAYEQLNIPDHVNSYEVQINGTPAQAPVISQDSL